MKKLYCYLFFRNDLRYKDKNFPIKIIKIKKLFTVLVDNYPYVTSRATITFETPLKSIWYGGK